MGRCNESDDAQEDRACGGTLCDVHLPCAEVLYRASLPQLNCGLVEWQKIKAACGGKKRKPMQGYSITIVLRSVVNRTRKLLFCGPTCGAWTTLQARLIMLGEDHMSLITYGETHTRVKMIKGALLYHSETSQRGQYTRTSTYQNPVLLAHTVRREVGV